MTHSDANDQVAAADRKTSRRDWVLLPLISLLTISLLAIGTELIARSFFTSKGTLAACEILNDPLGQHGVPDSACKAKLPESSMIEYKFNRCGHRSGLECGRKSDGSYRIVTTGASAVMGFGVRQEDDFSELLTTKLSRLTGRRIEVYNSAFAVHYGGTPRVIAQRFNDLLGPKPDMILWSFGPNDVEFSSILTVQDNIPIEKAHTSLMTTILRLRESVGGFTPQAMGRAAHIISEHTFSTLMLQHYLYESQSIYVEHFLMADDEEQGFLKSEPSAEWRSHLQEFDGYAAQIEGRAKAAGIPLVAVFVPSRAQAAMISMGKWPAGYDPYKMGEQVRRIITSHGGTYIDILPGYRTLPNPEREYLPVDGHPNADGHAMIAALLAKGLTDGTVPALKAAWAQQAAFEQGK